MPNLNGQLLDSHVNPVDNLIEILKDENMIAKYRNCEE